jgi:hypothetical protein
MVFAALAPEIATAGTPTPGNIPSPIIISRSEFSDIEKEAYRIIQYTVLDHLTAQD